MQTQLVRGGAAWRHPDDSKTGRVQHTLAPVYGEMLMQIAMDYPGLPDPRHLTLSEIRFWYEGLRHALIKRTAPQKK